MSFRTGARKIGAGTVHQTGREGGCHHHGELESVIDVVKGESGCEGARGWNFSPKVVPCDFILVPPYVPHQEINASTDKPLECVVIRSDNEAVAVNIDIAAVDKPDYVAWVGPSHKA